METCLTKVAEIFNTHSVVWALGASMLLHYKGLVKKPNDIDIIVDIKCIDLADRLLQDIGIKLPTNSDESYATKYFYKYKINEFNLDLLSGFTIIYDKESYEYVLNRSDLEFILVDNVKIPLTPIEDWYVLYMLMPNRQSKVHLIEKYLTENGVNKIIVKDRLKDNLPQAIKSKLNSLLLETR